MITIVIVNNCLQQETKEVGKEGIYTGIFRHGDFSDIISFEIKKDPAAWNVFFYQSRTECISDTGKQYSNKRPFDKFYVDKHRYPNDFKNE